MFGTHEAKYQLKKWVEDHKIERINQRARSSPLSPGDKYVVYVSTKAPDSAKPGKEWDPYEDAGVAVANPSVFQNALVSVVFRDQSGQQTGTAGPYNVPAHGHISFVLPDSRI